MGRWSLDLQEYLLNPATLSYINYPRLSNANSKPACVLGKQTRHPHLRYALATLKRTLFSLRARILSSKSWRILSCSQKTLSFTWRRERLERS